MPWLTRKTLSYLPANALPNPSSCRLLERTMIGYWPKCSSISWNASVTSGGNAPSSRFVRSCSPAVKYPSLVRCSINSRHHPLVTM